MQLFLFFWKNLLVTKSKVPILLEKHNTGKNAWGINTFHTSEDHFPFFNTAFEYRGKYFQECHLKIEKFTQVKPECESVF